MPLPASALALIAVTCIVSFIGFSNQELTARLMFNPYYILREKQWDRLLSPALIHGGFMHLFFNMFTLYFFSAVVVAAFGQANYFLIYAVSVLCGNLMALYRHRNDYNYMALGASGGVSGIVFAFICLAPQASIMIFPIPIPIPCWVYAVAYMLFSIYGMKAGVGNIGHEAHLGGALTGLLIAIALKPRIIAVNGLYIGLAVLLIGLGALLIHLNGKNRKS